MHLAERIAPALSELLGRPLERNPAVIAARRKLLAAARGRVLEVGSGPGFNLPHYPDGLEELVLTDSLEGMLSRAERRAREHARTVATARAPVESLPYPDGSFDTVVGSLLLCSVADQDRALAEIRRVLKPGGQYLFLEHVRFDDPKLARWQDRLEPIWRRLALGCHPNRETLTRIQATFDVGDFVRDELPHVPRIVRPYVLGRALAS